ncbi:MAG: glycoside hydrolase family 113 [Thermoanaerobaculia bacterium]
MRTRLRAGAALLLAFATPLTAQSPRRVALRLSPGLSLGPHLDRLSRWAKREAVVLDIGADTAPVPAGSEVLRLSLLPPAEPYRRRLARFPVRLEEKGFSFDGRTYREPGDAIALADPGRPGETLVFGVGEQAVVRLAARTIFWREEEARDYRVVSGELTKEGRWLLSAGALAIDRASDRDEIAAREAFLRSLRTEQRGGVRWILRDSERDAAQTWQPVLSRFLRQKAGAPLSVRIFPDAVAKGRETGSSRPADVALEGRGVRVDLDASAPREPDLVTPVLAAAALAAEDLRRARRETLLLAAGARAAGKWWGRDIASFSAFLDRAGVEPEVSDILSEDDRVSPVLAVGAAASWLEAGARREGVDAVGRALEAPEAQLSAALSRWRKLGHREKASPPAPRKAPPGFLRGISYAMSNSLDGGYVSPRSRATLAQLSKISANAISVMPFAFSPGPARPEISFVHRNPRGETDEGTVRAVADARALGMSTLVKPQIWLSGGAFVGSVAMRTEAEWKAWFSAYRRFAVHHAIVSEAAGAALYCVGTELAGTEPREREWRETIAAVRLATGATLLYAANWAAGAEKVPFWDALDFVGVDFYDPLSKDPESSDAELEAGARRAAEPVARLSRRLGKPVVFTEVGYPPVRGAWLDPHEEDSGRPRAPEDAARAIAAVFRALEGEAWWKGVYWWKAFSDGRGARPGESGFNLLGTPSEKAIAAGFARAATDRAAR